MESPSTDPLATNPPIVLIHGLWMTPRSWEHWKERYERRGYEVVTPAYPGLEVEVEAVDHVMPAAVNRSNYEHYKSAAHTDYKEFEARSHFTVGQPGWEEVADYALNWCNEHTGRGVLSTAQ
jgi:esterase/lipase